MIKTKIAAWWTLAISFYFLYKICAILLFAGSSPEGIAIIYLIILLPEFIALFFPALFLLTSKRKMFWIILLAVLLDALFLSIKTSSPLVSIFVFVVPLLLLLIDSRNFWKVGK
jgi:hypothetical protein